jgi:putative endonuclease
VPDYYVYLMTNNSGTLYVGVTNNLERRVWEHKTGATEGFTKRYKISRLIYYETTPSIKAAIEREKTLKGWTRTRELALVRSANPRWKDLSDGWYPDPAERGTSAEDQILRSAQNDGPSLVAAQASPLQSAPDHKQEQIRGVRRGGAPLPGGTGGVPPLSLEEKGGAARQRCAASPHVSSHSTLQEGL